MTWETIFRTDRFSVQIAPQSSLLVAGSVFEAVLCDLPQRTYRAVQSATARSRAKAGARHHPLSGKRMPMLAIKWPVNGQPGDYDFTTDTPDEVGLNRLLLDFFQSGRVSSAYQATCFEATGSDANTWINKTTAPHIGNLAVHRNSTSGDCEAAWVTDKSGAGPFTLTLFEDCGVVPADDSARMPAHNYWPDGPYNHPGYTVRVAGEGATESMQFVGFVPETITLTIENDQLMAQAEGTCYGGEEDGPGDGLVALTSILEMDSVIGSSRFVLGSGVAYNVSPNDVLNDGTADPYGSPDVKNVSWTFTAPHSPVEAPSAICGVSECVVSPPDLSVSLAVPTSDEYNDSTASTENVLVAAWTNRTKLSFNAYFGKRAGRGLCLFMGAGVVSEAPTRTEIDGVEYWQATLFAGSPYTTPDSASTNGGNEAYRIGAW